jgi:copper chaperone CopZ
VTQTIDLIVTGEQPIHCASCEQRIGNGLRRLPGVRSARASSKTQRVEVAIDPAQVSPERVRAKLGQLGFAAELTGRPGV